jgi:hypothetical protein
MNERHTITEVLEFYTENWHVKTNPEKPGFIIMFLIAELIEMHMRIGSNDTNGMIETAKEMAKEKL